MVAVDAREFVPRYQIDVRFEDGERWSVVWRGPAITPVRDDPDDPMVRAFYAGERPDDAGTDFDAGPGNLTEGGHRCLTDQCGEEKSSPHFFV